MPVRSETPTPSEQGTHFTRMDRSTPEQWAAIFAARTGTQPRAADVVLGMLRSLEAYRDGFAVDLLTHSLQTAARAEAASADEELIVASLLHDVGKLISVPNHSRVAAEILRPYVRDELFWVVAVHQDFQGRHYYAHLGLDPDARDQHRSEPWYDLAEQFADEWDQLSFDPQGPIPPLEHFGPMVRSVFSTAHQC